MIIIPVLLLNPLLLDQRQCGASITARVAIWNWEGGGFLGVEDARVGGVEVAVAEGWGGGPGAETVRGVGCNVLGGCQCGEMRDGRGGKVARGGRGNIPKKH